MSATKLENMRNLRSRKRDNLVVTVLSRVGEASEVQVQNLRTGKTRSFGFRGNTVKEWLPPEEALQRLKEKREQNIGRLSNVSADIFDAIANKL